MEARHVSYDFMGNMCGRLSIQVGTYVVNALAKMRQALLSPDNRILATNIARRVSLGDRSFVRRFALPWERTRSTSRLSVSRSITSQ